MRGLARIIVAMCAVCLAASPLYANGIVNKQIQSADYMRTLNRHAATDYADIAVYNPAGIAKMENDGLYTKLDMLYFGKDYSNTVPDGYGSFSGQSFGELDQDESSFLSGFFTIYKQEKWAGYFAVTAPAGGGELDYKEGSARMVLLSDGLASQFNAGLAANGVPSAFFYDHVDSMEIDVEENYVRGYTLGATYEINEMFALSLGARFSTGEREFEGATTISATNAFPLPGVNPAYETRIKVEQDADGWAGIVGLNIAPVDKVNIGLTYISKTEMEYENDVKKDTILPDGSSLATVVGFGDGDDYRIDIPAMLGFGASYQILPQLKLDFNYVLFFEKDAAIDTYDGEGNSWEMGLSAEYRFSPKWMVSVGYGHSEIKLGTDEQIKEPEEPKLDADALAAGIVYNPLERLTLTFGGLRVWFDSVTDSNGIEYDKDIYSLVFGAQYRFF